MTAAGWIGVLAAGFMASYFLIPDDPEPPPARARVENPLLATPSPPASLALPPLLSPSAAALPAVRKVEPFAAGDKPTASGSFAPRPRPAAVIAYGAAAPLPPGQDTSGYFWGGVKPDLSD